MTTTIEEQAILRDMARDWVTTRAPVLRLRQARDRGDRTTDPALWRELAEMGWTGALVPEAQGGTDLGFAGMGILIEEAGRTLAAVPLLSAALGGVTALRLTGTGPAQAAWLQRIASGEALVVPAIDGRAAEARPELIATPAGAGWRLDGTIAFVADGMAADGFVVPAATVDRAGGEGLGWFVVPAADVGRRAIPTVDSRDHALLDFADVAVLPDGLLGHGDPAPFDALLDRLRIGLAAEMIGTAQAVFDMTIDYLRTREQFGRPIGAFQALQHRAAHMLVSLELSRAAVEAALAAVDAGDADLPALAALAKAGAAETLNLVSNEAIQLHGGIGMTDEHDAGLFLKRARVAEALYGSASALRRRFAALRGF